jgi:hypothetical protein
LMDEQMAGVQVLAGIVTARIEAVIVEDVQGNALLGKEVQELGVEVHLAVKIQAVHILDRHRLLFPGLVLDVKRVVFALDAPIGQHIIVLHR